MHYNWDAKSREILSRYCTNLDENVFALRSLPQTIAGAAFSRYSRTEKDLRTVLLTEFIEVPESGLSKLASSPDEEILALQKAESFYERVLVGYGDDSVAELAGAHLAIEKVSLLAAKIVEDSRIGLSAIEKSTRYVRFDLPDSDNRYLYLRHQDLSHPLYEKICDDLFSTYSSLVESASDKIRQRFPIGEGESERAWKTATRAKAFDLLRGLLPASTLTNVGLYGNARAFEQLIIRLSASTLSETKDLAQSIHRELTKVLPAFTRRALDPRYGLAASERMNMMRLAAAKRAPKGLSEPQVPGATLVSYDPDNLKKVTAAILFSESNLPLQDLLASPIDSNQVLEEVLGGRTNRRQKLPRALENATYTFELVGNFGAYRDLQRHRMLTQERQRLSANLGCDIPPFLVDLGLSSEFILVMDRAAKVYSILSQELGPDLAQYAVPIAYRMRWYMHINLREIYHLCELRTTPQGHPDYRFLAQEMFRLVQKVNPILAKYASFVDLSDGDELERRASERKIDEKMKELDS